MTDNTDMQATINAIEALEDTLSGAELKIACTMTDERILEIAAPHFNVSESRYGKEFNPHPQYHGSDLSVIAFARALLTKGD